MKGEPGDADGHLPRFATTLPAWNAGLCRIERQPTFRRPSLGARSSTLQDPVASTSTSFSNSRHRCESRVYAVTMGFQRSLRHGDTPCTALISVLNLPAPGLAPHGYVECAQGNYYPTLRRRCPPLRRAHRNSRGVREILSPQHRTRRHHSGRRCRVWKRHGERDPFRMRQMSG